MPKVRSTGVYHGKKKQEKVKEIFYGREEHLGRLAHSFVEQAALKDRPCQV